MWTWLTHLFKRGPIPSDFEPGIFALELGDEVIAKIVIDGLDFPWTYGQLLDSPKFERFRTYFTDVDSWPEDNSELERICSEVHAKGHFRLRCLTTHTKFTDLVLHQQGNVVWFRYRPEENRT